MKKLFTYLLVIMMAIPTVSADYTTTIGPDGTATITNNKTGKTETPPAMSDEVFEVYDWARKNALTTQDTLGFRAMDYVSREEVAVIIKRAFDNQLFVRPKAAPQESKQYNDHAKIAKEFREAVDFLQKNGIMKGDKNGNFHPKRNITVYEIAILLSRALDNSVARNDAEAIRFFEESNRVEFIKETIGYTATRLVMFDLIKITQP